jgi:complex I intermediate-associated protein 30 (CIA30)
MRTLIVCLVALAAAQPAGDARVIADFEGGKVETRFGLALWPYADEQFGGTSVTQLTLVHPGAAGSKGALRIALDVTDQAPAPFAGVWAMAGPDGRATDLSAYRGVRFYARSRDRAAFAAGIVRFAGQVVRYATPFEAPPEWTLVELPFDRFRQALPPGAPEGSASPLDAKDITSIGITTAPQQRGRFEIDLDRLEVYR